MVRLVRMRPSVAVAATALMLLAAPAAQAAATPTWQTTGAMALGRGSHVAVPLGDGGALVAGGDTNGGGFGGVPTATAERYDAVAGAWTLAAPMATARVSATATVLRDGTVLVAGGTDGGANALASAERYDPATDSWASAGTMATARSEPTATLLRDGTVLVAGGSDSGGTVLASAERYDPATNGWSPAASPATARAGAVAALLRDGTVLVAGGSGTLSTPLASAERYDPTADSWSAAADMSTPRWGSGATTLADGSLLVAGGFGNEGGTATAERYDPAHDTWARTGNLGQVRSGATAVRLTNGTVLLSGGSAGVAERPELYDPVSDRWYPAGTQTSTRFTGTVTLLGDGSVLAAGGVMGAGFTHLSSAERFRLATVVDAPPLDFGDVTVGRGGPVLAVALYDVGELPLFVTSASLTGLGASAFSIAYDHCTGTGAVAAGSSCSIGVRFASGASGALSASLTLAADVPGGSVDVALSGTGTPPAAATIVTNTVTRQVTHTVVRAAAKLPTLHCTTRSRAHVSCTGVPKSVSRTLAHVRLTRGRTVYATGTLHDGRLALAVRQKLAPNRYLLTVVGKRRYVKLVVR
jgi:N-acetylneuraminic acid mutarotase